VDNVLRLLASFVFLLAGDVRSRAAEIHVFAAASLSDALKAAVRPYELKSGSKILFNWGASNFLARQIEAGAPADLFFSADEAQMDNLERKNLLVGETRSNLLSNSLVIVAPPQNPLGIRRAADLARPQVKTLALADPQGVPAGIYARAALQKLGLWDQVKTKVVPTDNVRAALAAVEAGNADAGIVYHTDVLHPTKVVVVVRIAPEDSPAIRYPVAILKSAPQPQAARELLMHLKSSPAAAEFQKFGFGRVR
jgi:molybdate transport system substrate-binding protein